MSVKNKCPKTTPYVLFCLVKLDGKAAQIYSLATPSLSPLSLVKLSPLFSPHFLLPPVCF